MEPKKPNDDQITPDLNLNAIMEEGMERFSGELEQAAAGEAEPSPETPGSDKGPDANKAAEEAAAAAAAVAAKPKDTPLPAGAGEPEVKPEEFRFKSQPEAEKGYRHIQSEKTRLEEDNKTLRAQVETLSKADQVKADKVKAKEDLRVFIKTENAKALAAINKLDADTADYDEKVADIWADKDMAITGFIDQRAVPAVPAAPAAAAPAAAAAVTPAAAPAASDPAVQMVLDRASELATAEGLDPKDEFFQLACLNTPDRDADGNPLPLDAQIGMAINRTKTYLTAQGRTIASNAEENLRIRQAADLPLGESAASRSAAAEKPAVPMSLNAALDRVAEERRL